MRILFIGMDHGTTGISFCIMSDAEVFVNTWLMSCRVLKRGMEEFIINKLVEKAKEAGFSIINAEYLKTEKNSMVKDIYSTMGFEDLSDGKYRLSISDYKENKTYIVE